MLKEPVETTLNPSALTDLELLRFADEAVKGTILGMTRLYQFEVLTRFEKVLNRIAEGELVEPDNTNDELQSEVYRLEDEVSDLEREVDRLNDELDALKTERNE